MEMDLDETGSQVGKCHLWRLCAFETTVTRGIAEELDDEERKEHGSGVSWISRLLEMIMGLTEKLLYFYVFEIIIHMMEVAIKFRQRVRQTPVIEA